VQSASIRRVLYNTADKSMNAFGCLVAFFILILLSFYDKKVVTEYRKGDTKLRQFIKNSGCDSHISGNRT